MKNYYNYFTEIEERFQQRRGSILMLSTLDWALIESWREAEVPLAAVLRGIDDAFDKHDAKAAHSPRRVRQVNGLAWCAQAVLEAAELARDASIGAGGTGADSTESEQKAQRESGFEAARIARYLRGNAALLDAAALPTPVRSTAEETATRLRELAESLVAQSGGGTNIAATLTANAAGNQGANAAGDRSANPDANPAVNLEELDRSLSVLEEKLLAALLTATPEQQLTALRQQAARELAPYRGKMQAVQIRQVQQQLLQKRLLEAHALPRLSLFYMPHQDDARENAPDEDIA